jgi:two pore calcium channel protein
VLVDRIRYLLIARLLRLTRLLVLTERYQVMVTTFLKLIRSLMPYLGITFCLVCFFCTSSVQVKFICTIYFFCYISESET